MAPDPLEARDPPPEDPLDSLREAGEGLFNPHRGSLHGGAALLRSRSRPRRPCGFSSSGLRGAAAGSRRSTPFSRHPRGSGPPRRRSRHRFPRPGGPPPSPARPLHRKQRPHLRSGGERDRPTAGRHFPGPRECEALFADVPEAIRETQRIAERCTLRLGKARPIFPGITLPPGETAYSHLAKLAFHGLERRFARITPAHLERLASELRVIERLGFCEYFIVVGDIVRFARERGIEVVGRGSGAGSLVAHVLGITNVDPIEYGLYFERFLHDGRTDLPDIDIDLCWIRRDEVIDHVYRAYGHDRVAMISSHVTFQPHLAFREAIKAFGVPLGLVNRYSRRIPYIHA